MADLSNFLADLAERVKQANEAMLIAQRTTSESAIQAGGLLVEARAKAHHGEWLPFLERAGINERTARNFMTIWRSGLNRQLVADLGGVKATLTFLSRWRLPTFAETMIISDPERERDEQSVGRGAAFLWEDSENRGYFNVGMIVRNGDDEEAITATRPMKPMAEVTGGRPVNTLIHFMTSQGFTLPINEWDIRYIEREAKMPLVMAPFFTDGTCREPELAGGTV